MVFPPMTCLRLLFLRKARSLLIEKVLCGALFAFKMGSSQEVHGYILLPLVTLELSVMFIVLAIFSYLEV